MSTHCPNKKVLIDYSTARLSWTRPRQDCSAFENVISLNKFDGECEGKAPSTVFLWQRL